MINLLKKGFTLIELLIVIAIIGILTAVITTNLVAARGRARDARRKGDLQAIHQSLRLYYGDYQKFPLSTINDKIKGCGATGITTCEWNTAFGNGGSTIYMGHLPRDPSSSATATITYKYVSTGGDTFALVATLENASDPDLADSQARCSTVYTPTPTSNEYVVCAE